MKKFLSLLLLTCSAAFAAETVVLDVPARDLGNFTRLESKMSVNLENGTVSGVVTSVLDREVCRWDYTYGGYYGGYGRYGRPYPGPYGRPYPTPVPRYVCFRTSDEVATQSVLLQDLMIVNNEIILKAEAGEVKCGVIKKGRIFKNTIKIVLNGKCTLTDRMVRADAERRVQLVLVTK